MKKSEYLTLICMVCIINVYIYMNFCFTSPDKWGIMG